MYEDYLNTKEIAQFLGIGRDTVLLLCRERQHGFPAVRVGRRYQADKEKLREWKRAWYAGEFDIKRR
jgi:excisionase family DNA binding protein